MIIFDISRMAIHNGPGIRTMVHIKGCNLNCTWCSTPESKSMKKQLSYMQGKCISCKICMQVCSKHAISVGVNEQMELDWSICNNCLVCANSCPTTALSVVGQDYTAEELFGELIKDENFFRKSGGGITFSGGEVLLNVTDEMVRLFQMLKKEKISMGFDTAGCVKQSNIDAVLPYADYFLWDVKLLDDELHKKYTGQSNRIILENLHYIDQKGVDIYLRCPIITGVNDTELYFLGILQLAKKLNYIKEIHLLPLHHLGTIRYEKIGLSDAYEKIPIVNIEWLEKKRQQLEKAGFITKIIG